MGFPFRSFSVIYWQIASNLDSFKRAHSSYNLVKTQVEAVPPPERPPANAILSQRSK